MKTGVDRPADRQAEVDRLKAEIEALRQSSSWRLTAPIRAVKELYSGLSGRPSLKRLLSPGPRAIQGRSGLVRSLETEAFEIAPNAVFDVVFVVGCGLGESKRYRVYNVMDELRRDGLQVAALREEDLDAVIRLAISFRRLVVFRSAWHPALERFIAFGRGQSATIVYDVDDLVFEPESVAHVRAIDAWSDADRAIYAADVARYRQALQACDLVTTTTAFLADRARAAGVEAKVTPNTVNRLQVALAEALLAEAEAEVRSAPGLRVGYFSGSATHQHDFLECQDALLAFMASTPDAVFVLVGLLDLDEAWRPFADRIERHDLLPYAQMLRVLASIDINLAPLELGNPFCEGKSQLKIFEAGLVGVPTVASATVSFVEAITDGADGFLVRKPADWGRALQALAGSSELRARLGQAARARTLDQWGPQALVQAARAALDLDPPASQGRAEAVRLDPSRLRITWLLPGLVIGGGGHRNILRAAHHLARFGHEVRIEVLDTDKSSVELAALIREHFYPITAQVKRFDGAIASTDVLFATHWSTVETGLALRSQALELLYFVQDFEPAFYPMSSDYIRAENTYRLGLYAICSGAWCADLLQRDYGAAADFFEFPIDTTIYHPADDRQFEVGSGGRVVYFAKPDMPRRCFDLGLDALALLKARRPGVRISLFGSNALRRMSFPFPCEVLGLTPTIADLAKVYRASDVGLAFSPTNPSLTPYEMMACGLPVVDLDRRGAEINYGGRRDVVLLSDSRPEVMAGQIDALLGAAAKRAERSANGLALTARMPSEEGMARRIETLIQRRVAARPA